MVRVGRISLALKSVVYVSILPILQCFRKVYSNTSEYSTSDIQSDVSPEHELKEKEKSKD